jgi:hypothetical protein
MTYPECQLLFDQILEQANPPYPYNNEAYINYTRLNKSRMHRWDKQLKLNDSLLLKLKSIDAPQHWIIITEPWCGDAAHSVPFLMQMIAANALITYDIVLRDTEPFLIESYLTNGTRGIPKLVARDESGADIFTWGPRPKPAQLLINELRGANADYGVIKIALQQWYNADKGESICHELIELL